MMTLDILSNEATQAQIEQNAMKISNKRVAKKAEKTFMSHSIIRSNSLTDTARLDFVLSTAFVLSDFSVTTQQCVALAASVNLDSTRLKSAAEFAKHCKDDDICNVENSLLTITDDRMKEFYINAFYSQSHMSQLQKYAADLFELCVSTIANHELIENAHEQALIMHSEHAAQQKKAVTKRTRKTAAAKK